MIYVIQRRTGQVLFADGTLDGGERALTYVTRRAAINRALAMRNGFAANVCEPVLIVSHQGRRLTRGDNLFARQTRRTPDGAYRQTRRHWREVIAPLPWAIEAAWKQFQARWPKLQQATIRDLFDAHL